jgi:hypothetical protein
MLSFVSPIAKKEGLMLGRKGWGGITRASMLIGSLSAAAFVFSATATTTVAQPSRPALEAGQRVHKTIFTIAPATLRTPADMEAYQAAHPSLGLQRASPRPLIPMGQKAYEAAKQRAALAPLTAKPMPLGANVPPPVAPTHIVKQFLGPKQADPSNSWFPPDSNGAIGGGYLVAPVNATFNVYNRKGTAVLNVDLTAFFGAPVQTFDPRVVYDPTWKRWVVAAAEFATSTTGGCFDLAISRTSNPTGSYWIYHLCALAAGSIWDYPMLGMNQDAVLFTGNNFDASNVYHGALMISMAKAVLYNGGGFSIPIFGFPTTTGTLTPPIVRDSGVPFFLARDADGLHLDLYKENNPSNAFYANVGPVVQIAASGLSVPASAPQPGTSEVLDTLDGRFQSPSSQYGNSLWNVHATGFPVAYYYQIDTNANSITTSGSFYLSPSSYDFNPSVAVNTNNDAIFTWSATDPANNLNAQVRFTGRQSGDASGYLGAGTLVFQSTAALTGNKQGSVQRWGDYSSTFLDSSSTCGTRAAIFNEQIVNASHWGLRVGIVGFC